MKIFDNIVVLCAGQSRRFFPLGDKNLFNFFDKSIIEHRVERLSNYSSKITLVVNKDNYDVIANFFSGRENVSVIVQENAGFANALLTLRGKVMGQVLVVGAVDLFDEGREIKKIEEIICQNKIILSFFTTKNYFPGGYGQFSNGKLTGIIEKPGADKTPSDQVRIVLDYFPDFDLFLSKIAQTDVLKEGAVEQVLTSFIKGDRCLINKVEGMVRSLKYPSDVLMADEFFFKNEFKASLGKNTIISDKAIVSGDVYFGDNVRVHEFAKIVGPSYIGANSVVGNYAMIVNSHIGSDCLVGGYSEVTRSHLGKRVLLHRNFIGDSVLSDNILIAAGTIFANWRFDRKNIHFKEEDARKVDTNREKFGCAVGSNVKVGINCSIMPGVRIAVGKIIKPASLIDRDVI